MRTVFSNYFALTILFIVLTIKGFAQRPGDIIDDQKFSPEAFNTAFNQITDVYIEVSNELLKTNAINTVFYFAEDTVDIHREWFIHLTDQIKYTPKMRTTAVQLFANGSPLTIQLDSFTYRTDTAAIQAKNPKELEIMIQNARNEQLKLFLTKEKEKVFKEIMAFADKEYIDSVVYENYLTQSNRSYTKAITIDMDKSFFLIYNVLKDRNFLTTLKSIKMAPGSTVYVKAIAPVVDAKLLTPIKYMVHLNSNRSKVSHTDSTFGQPSERLSISTNEILTSFSLDQRKITYELLAKKYIDECYQENSGRWNIIINKGEYKQSTSYATYNKVTRKWTCGTLYTAKGKDPSNKDLDNISRMQALVPNP
jgi:hypothetical protein